MSYGVTAAGFVIKPMVQITLELQTAYQAAFGAAIPLDGSSVFGQLIGIHSERESDLWQVAQDTYLAGFPDSATGTSFDSAAAVTGQVRLIQTFSNVPIQLTGTIGTFIPSGSQLAVTGTNVAFATFGDITIGAGGTATGLAKSVLPGPVPAPAGTLTIILSPVAGWTAVTNAAAAALGRFVETDAAFRARRSTNFITAVGGPIAAAQNAVSRVLNVTFAAIRENRTDATDAGGRPPHSWEVVVIGGADQDVANAIWAAKPAGLATYGTYTPQTVVDGFGANQTIAFTRGTNVPMYLDVAVTRTAAYPSDGDTQVSTAVVNFVNSLSYGQSVNNWQLVAALGSIPGITNVVILQDRNPTPTLSANTAIAGNEKATQLTANVLVH